MNKATEIRTMLAKMQDQIAAALPKHVTAERMMRVAMTAIQKTPALMECTTRSLMGCIVEASQLGLEPDGVLGFAYLVPFRNSKNGERECQLIPGYKGLVDLCRRSGQLSQISARIVYAKDKHRIVYGLHPKLEHTPADTDEPGEMIAVYAVANLKDGGTQFEWLWKKEVDAIRKRSKASASGPWVTDYLEMAKKTCLRRLCKLLPVSVEVQRFLAKDEQFDAGLDTSHALDVDVAKALPVEKPTSGLDSLLGQDSYYQEPEVDAPEAAPAPNSTQAQATDLFCGESATAENTDAEPAGAGAMPDQSAIIAAVKADFDRAKTLEQHAAAHARMDDLANSGQMTTETLDTCVRISNGRREDIAGGRPVGAARAKASK